MRDTFEYVENAKTVLTEKKLYAEVADGHIVVGKRRPSSRALQERSRTLVPRSPSAAVSLRAPMPTRNRPTSRTSPFLAA